MHYYKFNISDWGGETSHLTLKEEAILLRLVNFYLINEQPIPVNYKMVLRKLRLSDDADLVDELLVEFFEKKKNSWHMKKLDDAISDYQGKAESNRKKGKKGGRPKKTNENKDIKKANGFCLGFDNKPSGLENETQHKPNDNPNQEPLTKNQEPRTNIEDQETHVSSKLDTCALESDCEVIPAKKNKPKEKNPEYPDEFEWLWENKPSREGGNPKKKALSACKARLKQGHTWREMAEGLQRYKKYCDSTKITGSRVVQMMSTFFGTGLAFTESWAYAKDRDINKKSSLADRILERAIEENQRNGLTPTAEKPINEPANQPTRDNNGFSQWADNNTGSVVYDNDGSGIPTNMETRDTTGLLDMDAFVFGVRPNKISSS